MATGWQRQFAAAVREAQQIGHEPIPRRIALLTRRLSKVRYEYGELLFALFVCRDSHLSKEESEKEYLFRLRLLHEQLDGSEHWRKQYERRVKKQEGTPSDQAESLEDLLWRARSLFYLLLAELEACRQFNEPIYHETCFGHYQEHLAALGTALQACTICMHCGERFPHEKPQHRSWCRSNHTLAEPPGVSPEISNA